MLYLYFFTGLLYSMVLNGGDILHTLEERENSRIPASEVAFQTVFSILAWPLYLYLSFKK